MKNQYKIVLPRLPDFHPDERAMLMAMGVDHRFVTEIAANAILSTNDEASYAEIFTEAMASMVDSELTTMEEIDRFHETFGDKVDQVYSIAVTTKRFLDPYLSVFQRASDGFIPASALVGINEERGYMVMEVSFY